MHLRPSPALVALTLGTGACYHVTLPELSTDSDPSTSGPTSSGDLPPVDEPTGAAEPTTAGPEPTTTTSGTPDASSGAPTSEPAGSCGDGVLDPGEECDYGEDNSNLGSCTLTCTKARCGDGKVQEGFEECDFGGGNEKKYGGCTEECEWAARCGDGNLDIGFEECDLGEQNGQASVDGEAACTGGCRWLGRLVFVTSASYTGALGGVSGADLKCRTLAAAAGLENASDFRAWISDSASAPLTRFQQVAVSDAPYVLLDGRVLADDFTELVESGPRTGISLTEQGQALFEQAVWTNTTAFGESFSATHNCSQWLSDSFDLKGRFGSNAVPLEDGPLWDGWKAERSWTSHSTNFCNFPSRLYCFEDG